MGVIQIENLNDKVMNAIQESAAANGRSLQEELKEWLDREAERRSALAEFLDVADRIRAMTPKDVEQTDSTDIIREIRDRGYSSMTQTDDHAGR